jgi:hypothetical protein
VDIVAILFLVGITLAGKAAWDHAWSSYGRSRDARVKQAGKRAAPKGLGKAQRRSAVRRHAFGYWARETAHGFPAARTGWHAGWLGHKAAVDQQRAIREEKRTTHLETRLGFLKAIPEHRKRQAGAQAEIDKVLAEQAAAGKPAKGRRGVKAAAATVTPLTRSDGTPVWGPPAGTPWPAAPVTPSERGGTAPAGGQPPVAPVPPLPADTVTPRGEGAAHLRAPVPDPRLNPGQRRRDANGLGNACAACGNQGTAGDPLTVGPTTDGFRIHQSHVTDPASAFHDPTAIESTDFGRGPWVLTARSRSGQVLNALSGGAMASATVWDRADLVRRITAAEGNGDLAIAVHNVHGASVYRPHPTDAAPAGAPAPAGHQPAGRTPPVAETNYRAVIKQAQDFAGLAEQDMATVTKRRTAAEQAAEMMQQLDVDSKSLDEQMQLVERLAEAEKAFAAVQDAAASVVSGLKSRHGGIADAHESAPVRAAERPFYEGG